MVKAWLYLYILDYFLFVLYSINVFFSFNPFVHYFSCQMALLLWQMLDLSFVCPDFVGCTAFVSSSLLLLWWPFWRVWETVDVNSGDYSAFYWGNPSSEAEKIFEGICRKYSSGFWMSGCWSGTIKYTNKLWDSSALSKSHRHPSYLLSALLGVSSWDLSWQESADEDFHSLHHGAMTRNSL